MATTTQKRSRSAKKKQYLPVEELSVAIDSSLRPPEVKNTDEKGRVVLSKKFANRTVIVEEVSDTEVIVKLARVIPEREAWLYENPQALASVRRGLAQARARQFVPGPDLEADADFVAQLED